MGNPGATVVGIREDGDWEEATPRAYPRSRATASNARNVANMCGS
jgi:hypothetical protein